jgi:polyvinyl alcohol dehydrogenase (cytochrome)
MKLRSVLFAIFLPVALFMLSFCRESSPRIVEAADVSGEEIYLKSCAACHDQISPRIPPRAALQKLTASRILRTLDFGVMMSVAYPLRREEREAVAKFLGTSGEEAAPPASAFCSVRQPPVYTSAFSSWNGWSPSSSNARFQSAQQAGLDANQVRNLRLKWAFGFEGDITAFAAPTIQNGTLFVGSASGTVHAMNPKSGCLYWTFQANGPIRSAPLVVKDGVKQVILLADQVGWFYALDAQNGKQLWNVRIDEHEATRLTGSPVSEGGVVFVPAASWEETRAISPEYPCCTFRGSITALRVADGSAVWKSYLVEPPRKSGVAPNGKAILGPSGAGIWSAPTIDRKRGLIYVTTGDNYSIPTTPTSDAVVALELKTGKVVWSRQTTSGDASTASCDGPHSSCGEKAGPDYDYGSSAILVAVDGRDVLIAGQKSGVVYGLDPEKQGKILWRTKVGPGGLNGGIQWGMASDEQRVYAAIAHGVVLGQQDLGAKPVGAANFDPRVGGGLTALRLRNGAKVWVAPNHPCDPPRPGCSPSQSAALTAIPGVVFSGSLDGHLRAYSAKNGKVLWDFDTAKEYTTVNGVSGKGGSLDGAGPVIVDGILYVNSGYPRFGGMPGNVLLAFSAEDQK